MTDPKPTAAGAPFAHYLATCSDEALAGIVTALEVTRAPDPAADALKTAREEQIRRCLRTLSDAEVDELTRALATAAQHIPSTREALAFVRAQRRQRVIRMVK